MLKNIIHVGLTVKDINRSIDFYRDVLGLRLKGKLTMEGKETDSLFGVDNCKVEVAYLNGSEEAMVPPVELIQFVNTEVKEDKSQLTRTSISELCFKVKDIDMLYKHLLKNNVECISEPQYFDFTKYGFGESKALYFKDPDGIILEAIEEL